MERATISPMAWEAEPTTIQVPASVRFPVELDVPPGFDPVDPATWPRVEGRLEYLEGRLLFLPPCSLGQAAVAWSTISVIAVWAEAHPEFLGGTLDAGMKLGDDARGADAAVWRRDALGPIGGKFARVPPILAVEVEGRDEREPELREKARWYLSHGTAVAWIVLWTTREVIVVGPEGESRHGAGARLPAHPLLPGLEPEIDRFFRQLA